MTRRQDGTDQHAIDFFISYSPADERWAGWIAWQLESAGYRTLIQAWDFVPGTNFIDFMDRGVRDASVVVAVLSGNYLKSRYGTMEWQAALRTDPGKLVTVRVEDCPLDGLLGTITYLDLLDATDDRSARDALLSRMRQVLVGRAKPTIEPGFPQLGHLQHTEPSRQTHQVREPARNRRTPISAPVYPPTGVAAAARRDSVTVLHVPGPRFGRGLTGADEPLTARDLQSRIWANVTRLIDAGAPEPELIVVSGDLTEAARPKEVDQALAFLAGLRVLLGLENNRLVVVPGRGDVSKAACLSYFALCEARDRQPQEPFFPKLDHFAELFREVYEGRDELVFDVAQPWTLFAVPELRIAVAGLNSTLAISHRREDDHGVVGEAQAAWFAARLRPFEESGWLRLGVLNHDPSPAGRLAGQGPTLLRDAGTLDRLLGGRLNLLIHGPGTGGLAVDRLDSGLPAVRGIGPGRAQLIVVTQDGFARLTDDDRSERVSVGFRSVSGTFSAPVEIAAEVPADDEEYPSDPHGLLLERIAEVCATRFDRAKIRRIAGRPPHLLVTRPGETMNPQLRVGAHVGEVTDEVLDAFLLHEPDHGSELVYQGPSPTHQLREKANRSGVRVRSFAEFQGLLDLTDYVRGQTERLRADRRYPPDLYVPQRFRELGRNELDLRDDLVDELMRLMTDDHARFVLVLGDFGRGKTFVLREVARRIAETTPALIPILIELRALDKAHSVDGLVAAHLANHGEEYIDLKAFHYMLREGRIVLLFDGFDELVTRVTYDRAADHLETLMEAATDKAKIVVASRTQHFKSHAQVFTALGERIGLLPHRRVLGVEDFTPAQIRAYLVNRYDGDEQRADERLRLINGIQDLLGLSQNPRMLSFIADLEPERLRAAARSQHTLSAAALYGEILNTWLRNEAERAAGEAGAAVGLELDQLWMAVTTLALRLWESGETYLRLAELAEVATTLGELADTRLSHHQTVHAMGAGSLLVRTDEGLFGFIHTSVAEWLVANTISGQFHAGETNPAQLAQRPLSQLTVDFLCDLAEARACQRWTESVFSSASAGDVSRANAIRISTRLRTPATADLRGASLRGEDLSYRDFREVDLTGADLSRARLVGTNLTGAVLRDADLTGARLDETSLVDADLRGANLSRARLIAVDLTRARVTDSRWRRSALINSVGVPRSAELRGAAIMPGGRVSTEIAPASIGVRHGFHAEMGRLPQVLAYSPDGDTLAIGSDDGGVLICDSRTGLPLRTLQGHRDRVFAVAYGADVLATGAGDGTVRLWDSADGQPRQVLTGHEEWPWPVVLAPDGALLATGDAKGTLRLWDSATGGLLHEQPSGRGFIFSLAFHGALLATAYRDGSVQLWDVASGASLGELTGASGSVYRVAFSPDGDLLATGGQGGEVRLWDPATGRRVRDLVGHTGGVYSLAFDPSGRLLASGDTSGDVRVWDVATGALRYRLTGHDASIYWVVFDHAGATLATGDSAGQLRLWDTDSGRLRHTLTAHTGSVWPFAFRPDGRQLAVSDDQFTTRLWNPATGQCRHTLSGHGRQVRTVTFSPSGDTLATSGNDGVARLWDPRSGRQVRRLDGSEDGLLQLETVAFSPTGTRLATVSNDGRVNLLNLDSGRYERHLTVASAPIWALAFSPSGDELATANDDDTVQIWYRTTGRLIHTLGEHRGRVRSVAFSADGSLIATGCDDSVVRLWDAATGKLVRTLAGHADRVYAVSFGNGLLASASWDTTARIWDVATGQTKHVLTGHTGRLWTAAFNATGDTVATAGEDLVILLWEPNTGAPMRSLVGHTRSVWSVAFSPDGSMLASGGDDGTARLWPMRSVTPLTLCGLPDGWAALAPDGRYKVDGDTSGLFWHVVGMCRFEPGELDAYVPGVRQLPVDTPF